MQEHPHEKLFDTNCHDTVIMSYMRHIKNVVSEGIEKAPKNSVELGSVNKPILPSRRGPYGKDTAKYERNQKAGST